MADPQTAAEDIVRQRAPDVPDMSTAVWTDPMPLKSPREPAVFPTDALPEWVRAWVEAEAVATQTPTDLAGCCALGVLAAAAGGRAVVEARSGWREPVNLYLLPVLPPGARKSPVIAAATKPLYSAEEELTADARAMIAESATLRDIATKAAERAARAAANATADKRDDLASQAVSAASAAEAITVPTLPRLIADDVTPEAVGSLLAEQGGRLAIISAEGGIFDIVAGRYSNAIPVLDVWLKGHSGDPLRVDRKGRPSEYVRHPALTLLLTVQPTVLTALARNGVFRGRGLTARFLYALPPDNVGHRQIGAPPVPEDTADEWDKRVRQLVDELKGWTDPAVLQLTPEARERLLEIEREIEPRLARDGDYGAIREWGSKLCGTILRLAGLLHLAGQDSAFRASIDRATLDAAERIGRYFAEHAEAAHDLLGDGGTSDARYVLQHLQKRQLTEFTIRSLHADLPRGRFATADDVTSAVAVLAEHGYVQRLPAPERSGPGRKPSPRYLVHPDSTDTEST